jgi:hypothetical protein
VKTQYLFLLFILSLSFSVKAQFGSQQIIDGDVFGITKIITTDLNNNGFQDIITSQKYFNNHKVSYFLNTGGESFGPQIILTTNVTTPEGVSAGDLNGDGWADIVGISQNSNSVYWFPNDNGSFPTEVSLDTGLIMPEAVEIVDINNNGRLDIVVLDHINIVIYYNDGTGNFTKETIPNDEFEYYTFTIADLDGDGFKDIIIGSNDVLVYMNDNGQFTTHDVPRSTSIVNTGFCFMIHTADLNGNGIADLIIDGNTNSEIRWYANDGNGFFSLMQTIDNTLQCKSLSTADFTNDGDLDVFAALFQEGEVAWYENTGKGVFGNKQLVSTGIIANTVATATADLNNDGLPDLVWAHPLSFQLNTKPLSLNYPEIAPSISVYPNPVQDFLTIESSQSGSLTVFNTHGKTLIYNHAIEIGINKLQIPPNPQVYFLKFTSPEGIVVKRVVKE